MAVESLTPPVAPPSSGFRKGLLLGAGLSTLAFGSVALVGIGFALGTRSIAGTSVASVADVSPVVLTAKPVVVEVEAKPVVAEANPVVAEEKPIVIADAKPIEVAVVAPKPVVVEAKPIVVEPKPVVVEAKPVVRAVKPVVVEPAKPAVVARKVAPKPAAAPVVARPAPVAPVVAEKPAPARPNRDELAALAASARQKVAAPAPITKPAEKAPVAAYNWDDQPAAAAPAAASWAPVEEETESAAPAKSAAPAREPELDDILGTPAAAPSAKTPAAKTPAKAVSSARTIRARKGNVTIALNANIALTRTNGKPLMGKLIDVDGGFVAVKTADAQHKIAESDVIEAATY